MELDTMEMSELNGKTEKQIAWAEKIRNRVIKELEKTIAEKGMPEHPVVLEAIKQIYTEKSAAWWIGNYSGDGHYHYHAKYLTGTLRKFLEEAAKQVCQNGITDWWFGSDTDAFN